MIVGFMFVLQKISKKGDWLCNEVRQDLQCDMLRPCAFLTDTEQIWNLVSTRWGYGPYGHRHTVVGEKFLPMTHNFSFWYINWPARSIYLAAPDFFLWRHLKARVFQTRPHTIQDLKNRIQAAVQEINKTPSLLQSFVNNFRVRLQQVIRYQGDHLKCVI